MQNAKRSFLKYFMAVLAFIAILIISLSLYFRTEIQILLAVNDYEVGDYESSFKVFSNCAKQSPVCTYFLSVHYAKGLGVEASEAKALELTHRAAEAGVPEAQYNEGLFYQNGLFGFPKDAEIALDLYRKAASQGHVMALNNMGNIYRYGEAGYVRHDLAAVYFKQAADAGNAEGTYNLGIMFASGLGVKRDLALSFALIRYATDLSEEQMLEQFEFFSELSDHELKRSQKLLDRINHNNSISSVVDSYI